MVLDFGGESWQASRRRWHLSGALQVVGRERGGHSKRWAPMCRGTEGRGEQMLWDVREDPLGEKPSGESFREFRGRCASTCPTGA